MGIQKCGLNLNQANKELQPHGTSAFPCAAYCERYRAYPGGDIPWHWHEELEIVYCRDGKMKLQIPAKTYFLEIGDCLVINANVLHYAAAVPWCELQSLVFHPMLVTGSSTTVFATKYLLPLISGTTFDSFLLTADENRAEIAYFTGAFGAMADETPGYEFTVRENLSKMCCFLHSQFAHEVMVKETGLNQDNLRMRKMLDYIHNHFTDNIVLADIAKSANIGERECLRCFQRTIRLSPMQYLLKYRVMQAADMLLQDPAGSVAEIAAFCGFNSPSNFSKLFKRFYNCTPREYRSKDGTCFR